MKEMVVVTGYQNDLPMFGLIKTCLIAQHEGFVFCQKLVTTERNFHFNCFNVDVTFGTFLIKVKGLKDRLPLGMYNVPGSNEMAVVLKHKIV